MVSMIFNPATKTTAMNLSFMFHSYRNRIIMTFHKAHNPRNSQMVVYAIEISWLISCKMVIYYLRKYYLKNYDGIILCKCH